MNVNSSLRRLALVVVVALLGTFAVSSAASADVAAPAPSVTAGIARLTFAWSASDYPGVTAWKVELATESSPGTVLATFTPAVNSPTATFTRLDPSVKFIAVVTATAGSAVVSASSTPTNPLALGSSPTVTARALDHRVDLTWTRVQGVGGYIISRSGDNGGSWEILDTVAQGVLFYSDTAGLLNGHVYRYRVTPTLLFDKPAAGDAGAGLYGGASATPAGPPARPTGVTAVPTERGATVRWVLVPAESNGGRAIGNYRVVILGTGSGLVLPLCRSTSTTPCVAYPSGRGALDAVRFVRNLDPALKYRFSVRAVTSAGTSANSVPSLYVQPITKSPPFSYGMRGPTIVELQRRLTWAGLATPVTGIFDTATKKQVKHLQEKFLYDTSGTVSSGQWSTLQRITRSKGVLPSQCRGTAICVSKTQKVLRYIVNGKTILTMDARFGPEAGGLATSEGLFDITWKDGCSSGANPDSYGSLVDNCHISSQYKTPMPWSMFFNGGQAVHYSYFFNQDGYWGNSHGCINIRDWYGVKKLYSMASEGTPVYVYW